MTYELLIVVAIRLAVPLLIFRWPLWGGLAALFVDAFDFLLVVLLPFGGYPLPNYHAIDKGLDTYYLAIELLVSLRWPDLLCRRISIALFAYRLIGVVAFEITGIRKLLILFPNLFENFFLFYVAARRFAPDYELTSRRVAGWLGVLLVPKLAQEYALHYQEWHRDAVDILEDGLRWLRDRT